MELSPERLVAALSADVGTLRHRLDGLEAADAAQQVEKLRERVQRLEKTDPEGRLKALDQTVRALDDGLVQLGELVQELLAKPEVDPDPAIAPDWDALTADQAKQAWKTLLDWGWTLAYPRYLAGVWRPCWYQHPRVFWQLSALCAYYHWAFLPGAPPTRATDWHLRMLPGVKETMKSEFGLGKGRTKRCGVPSTRPGERAVTLLHVKPDGVEENAFADTEAVNKHIANDLRKRREKAAATAGTTGS